MQIRLQQEQNYLLATHLRRLPQARVHKLIRYPSGRLLAELVGPQGVHTVNLTPSLAPPKRAGWNPAPWAMFLGLGWASIALMLMTDPIRPLPLPLGVPALLVGALVGLWGIWRMESRLGRPLLLSPHQGRVLSQLWRDGWHIHTLEGGGGTHVLGRGPLLVHAHDPQGRSRWVLLSPEPSPHHSREPTANPTNLFPLGGKSHEEASEPT